MTECEPSEPRTTEAIERLRHALDEGASMEVLARLLEEVWEGLDGDPHETAMASWKARRIESFSWEPPILYFDIERHGAIVMGGTRAEVQTWAVDLDQRKAWLADSARYRQLRPMAPRFRAKPLAAELAAAIVAGEEDERLERRSDGTVRVLLSQIPEVSQGYKETIEGRRQRLAEALAAELTPGGWERAARPWHYRQQSS